MNRDQLIRQLRAIAKKDASATDIENLADTIIKASKAKREPGASGATTSATYKTAKEAAKGLVDAVKGPEEVMTASESLVKSIKLLREEREAFVKSGYANSLNMFKEDMKGVADESLKLSGNFKSFANVSRAFRDNFKSLDLVNKDFRQSIMKAGVAMDQAGFSMDSFARIVDNSVFSFGMSKNEVEGLSATLIRASREFQIAPKALAENFEFAQKNFAYTSDKLMTNFLELQKMSKMTGVGFGTLANSFGSSMDTFQGSAQRAGRLNMILGKSVFNSIDLLGKTEAQRAKLIREGIMKRLPTGAKNLKKFELLAIAKELNMTPDQARRFIRGESFEAINEQRVKELKKTNPAEMVKDSASKLANEVTNIRIALSKFREPLETARIDLTFKSRAFIKEKLGFDRIIENARSLGRAAAGVGGAQADPDAAIGNLNIPSDQAFVISAILAGRRLSKDQIKLLAAAGGAKLMGKIPVLGELIKGDKGQQTLKDVTELITQVIALNTAAKTIKEAKTKGKPATSPRTMPQGDTENLDKILKGLGDQANTGNVGTPTTLVAQITIELDGKEIDGGVRRVDIVDLNQGGQANM